MKLLLRIIFFLLSISACQALSAQDSALKIHPFVGYDLDQEEILRYDIDELIDFYWNKYSILRFYDNGEGNLKMLAVSRLSGIIQSESNVPVSFLEKIRELIKEEDSNLLANLEALEDFLKVKDSVFVRVATHYGFESEGEIWAIKKDTLFFTQGLTIGMEDLKALRVTLDAFNPFRNPTTFKTDHDRYLLGSNAMGMEKGELVYKNAILTISSVNYGISKNLSIGGGFEGGTLLFNLLDAASKASFEDFQAYVYAEIKASKKIQDGIHMAVGAVYGGGVGFTPTFPAFGMAYVSNTIGNSNLNLSTTLYLPLNFATTQSTSSILQGSIIFQRQEKSFVFPPLSLAFAKRVAPKVFVVSENFYYSVDNKRILEDDFGVISDEATNNQNYLISLGARLLKRRAAWDLGMVVWARSSVTRTESLTFQSFSLVPLPYFSINFRLR